MDSTFVVPLPKRREAFFSTEGVAKPELNIRVVPANGKDHAPVLKGLSVLAP
jgi:tyrosinase